MLSSSSRNFQPLIFLSGMTCAMSLCFAGCFQGNERLRQGQAALEKKEYAAAVEHFSEALIEQPSLLAAFIGRAQAHEQLREFSAAISDYEAVLAWYPKHPLSNERIGQVYLEMGEGFKAREHIIKLDKILPPREYLLAMARAELMCGEAKQSLEYIDRLLSSEPNSMQGIYYRGIAHANLGQLKEADADFTTVIELDPEKASAYWRRAVVRDRMQETKLAAADRKRATELDPTHAFGESEMGKSMVESLKGTSSETGAITIQSLEK